MCVELKIKAKHLALEPGIIKMEERKLLDSIKRLTSEDEKLSKKKVTKEILFNSLVNHRKWNVRNESRATHLARAFLNNKAYAKVEASRKSDNEFTFNLTILPRTLKMIQKYGSPQQRKTTIQDLQGWSSI